MKNLVMLVLALFVSIFFVGCQNEAQTGAGVGAGLGAALGGIVGHQSGKTAEGAAIGAAVGGGAGYMIGSEKDKASQARQLDKIRYEANQEVIWITNSNGSQIPITLLKDGPAYIGPRGERYPARPSEQQLRAIYGF